MKNIDETISTVFDRMENYKAAQKRRHKIALGIAVPVCLVCMIAVVGFGIWKSPSDTAQVLGGKQSISGTLSAASNPTVSSGEIPVSDPTVPKVENGNKIVIGSIDREIKSEMGIALHTNDFISMTKEELTAYYGCNVFPADSLAVRCRRVQREIHCSRNRLSVPPLS